MTQDPITLYKLIVLYMLDRVDFPLTRAQISDFILDRGYTNYLNLQTVFSELAGADMVVEKTIRNRTQLKLTEEGVTTLHFFVDRLSSEIKDDIDTYLKDKSIALREEISVTADYHKATSGDYVANLSLLEKGNPLLALQLSVPTEGIASAVCTKWEKSNQEVYSKIMEQLL